MMSVYNYTVADLNAKKPPPSVRAVGVNTTNTREPVLHKMGGCLSTPVLSIINHYVK